MDGRLHGGRVGCVHADGRRRQGVAAVDGLTMDLPLTVPAILERARRGFPQSAIVTRTAAGLHRYTYEEFVDRVERLAGALVDLGIQPGDRVATFAWNTH